MPSHAHAVFLFCLLCFAWFTYKLTQHLKNPKRLFIGNVAPSGRKYVWLCFLAWLIATIAIFWDETHQNATQHGGECCHVNASPHREQLRLALR